MIDALSDPTSWPTIGLLGHGGSENAHTRYPRPVGGLARALRALDRDYRPWLLAAVSLGLVAFGVLQILSARYRRFRMG